MILLFTAVSGQLLAALLVKYFGRYKLVVVFGVCLKILGGGLLYRYRRADQYLGQIIVSQIVMGAGEGVLNTIQAGMQAAVNQDGTLATPKFFH